MVAKKAGTRRAHNLGKSIESGGAYAGHTLEMAQKFLLRGRADTLDLRELADYGALGAAVAVMGDTEAVGFVAKLLHHPQAL